MLASVIAMWLGTSVLSQHAAATSVPATFVASAVAAEETPYFNLEFPGGTLRAYVAALQKATSGVNVVVSDFAADLAMPPVSLKHIDVLTALSIIERTEQRPDGPMVVELERVNASEEGATATYRVQVSGSAPRAANDIVIESIADVISAGMKAEAVLSAIEAGTSVALGDRAKAMELSFHEPTSLLMARGPVEGCSAARQVVASLRSATRPSKSALEAQFQEQLAGVRGDAETAMMMTRRDMESQLMESRMKVAELQAALEATKATAEIERARFEKLAQDAMARFNEANAELTRLRLSGGKPG